ncbi:hypothetical protein Ddye_016641 [Dipteronia dyeriana]|uniref:Chromatin modification-related protein EAF1 B-like n=1 Tax=Dipteronia dyeriana TaxID=168575 RepID=A0AAD9U805_9ROSI|nr:hypothetical protein Ddye_016641 [Dipteronia dyeriana]
MHGCGSGTALIVNAEVDSMGGVVDGGVGIGVKTSPCRAAIEKAQAELRQEYDVREERRRELEFLEKGGNPLDFKFGNAASVSVQSTSLTDQQAEHIVTSEAKGSFALTASPHGDSVESSGRPGIPTGCEPNSADNLLLFDGENELVEGDRNSVQPVKRKDVVPSEQSPQMDGTQNAKESEDSAIFRPYARRYRSKPNRDGGRSSSNDVAHTRAGHGSSLTARGGSRDGKGSISDSNNQKEQKILSVSNLKSASSNGDMVSKIVTCDNQLSMGLDSVQPLAGTTSPKGTLPEDKLDVAATKSLTGDLHHQSDQVDAHQNPLDLAFTKPDLVGEKEQIVSAGVESLSCAATEKAENEGFSGQQNGFGDLHRDRKPIPNEGQTSTAGIGTKGLDSESSCTQNSLSLDVNNDSDACINLKIVDSNGILMERTSELEGTGNLAGGEVVKEKHETKNVDCCAAKNEDQNSLFQNHSGNGSIVKVEEDIKRSRSDLQIEMKCSSNIERVLRNDHTTSQSDKNLGNVSGDNSNFNQENSCPGRSQGTPDVSICELPPITLPSRDSADAMDVQTESDNQLKLADKAYEDSILEEARIIEAKRKRIAELSVGLLPLETRRKSHWDFVLEEMAWLANDFAQERLWKTTAAAQICHQVAFVSRLRSEEKNQRWKIKNVALTLAKAVMQFWHSAEMLLNSDDPKHCRHDLDGSSKVDGKEISEDKVGELDMDTSNNLEQQSPRKNAALGISGYAVRFLKYNSFPVPPVQADAPATPERISDSVIMKLSWDDHLTEESLFYAIPAGAMEAYRKSIESHVLHCEKTGRMQEEVDTSMYDAIADFGYHDSAYDEDEGETSTYYLPGAFEGSKSSKFTQRKRKNSMKSYAARSYELGADIPYGHGTMGSQQSMLMGKRPASNLNVGSIPTKRMRTASRQRVISPFNAAATGSLQAPAKTDASSGDTNSFQDDQSTLHGGSQIQKCVEVESVGDFEKQLTYDSAETSTKSKKKKKPKHLGSAYEQNWQLDSTVYNEQRDNFKKRLESHHFDSNGTGGLYGQHNAKKPKIMKQSLDTTFDNITPMTGSIPSPAASQMSNMSNPTKFIKLIGGRDRGRKAKALKMSAGHPGPGSPWSLFEDQALVVLVHDMGPNWELVSDAMNSTLQFKCIFRKPKECKERHKILMDRGAGDGADSAEDSGSSQSYPSTLPGIPKGSARQLFQRLQGPMEEDTVKSHFEKIIMIGKKQHYRKSQNDNQDSRQPVAVHNSHVIALSQVCPNNLNGSILTPLELCDVTASSPEVFPLGIQGSHAGGLGISNQGPVASILPTSGANASLQGSSGIVLGSNLASPSGPLNPPVREGRYGVPRTSLPVDEQQRIQQYNQMLSGRNIQQPNLSAPGALSGAERGVRMLPGGNSMGVMCGMNRSMPMPRPGYQGMASSSMLNSGSMLSSSIVGMANPVNMHSGAGSVQGNSMLRPREAMHMMRPGHNPDHQRQLMVPELQMQVTQGNGQGLPAFNGLSSGLSNQTTSPVQTYAGHPQQQHQVSSQQPHGLGNHHPHHLQGPNHATGSQQQVYAIRLAKERQIQQQQQRYLQQQQQFAASGALMPHVQPQTQLPISSSLQNNSQIQSQTSSQPVSMPPVTPSSPMTPMSLQHQQKHHLPSHGLSRNPQSVSSGLNNQMGKQRQRQPQQQQFQQSGRQHPQQRQHGQSQQQAKLLKGIGRGNMVLHQNLTIDPSHLNGLTAASGNQAAEKGEQIMHLMQGQGLYSGSGLNPVQPSKPLVSPQTSNHSQPQQNLFSGTNPPASKQLQPIPSHSDNSPPGQVPPVPSGHTLSATHQAVLPAMMASNHQHLPLQPQSHQKPVNQTQTLQSAQRMLQQDRQANSDPPSKSQTDQSQADQQPINNASLMVINITTAVSQVCTDSANIVPVSSAVPAQWKASEPLYDSGMQTMASQVGSIGSPPLTNSSGNDAITPVSQGLGQRQLSGSMPPLVHNVGAQWQQQSQLQQSPTQLPTSQQHCQPQDQQVLEQDQQQLPQQTLPQQQQSQQQTQHLQAAQGNLYIRPTNSKLE